MPKKAAFLGLWGFLAVALFSAMPTFAESEALSTDEAARRAVQRLNESTGKDGADLQACFRGCVTDSSRLEEAECRDGCRRKLNHDFGADPRARSAIRTKALPALPLVSGAGAIDYKDHETVHAR